MISRVESKSLSFSAIILLAAAGAVAAADTDRDGLPDAAEDGGGIYFSPSVTGTRPDAADSDGDGVPDGLEVFEKTNPNLASSYSGPSRQLLFLHSEQFLGSDLSAGSSNLTQSSSITSTPAGASFDGTGSFSFSSAALAQARNDITICLRVQSTATSGEWKTLIDNRPLISTGFGLAYNHQKKLVEFCLGASGSYAIRSWDVDLSQRARSIAVVKAGSEIRWYSDGMLVSTQTLANSILASSVPVSIGSRLGTQDFFKGIMNDLRVYSRPLTEGEIDSLATFQQSGTYGPPQIPQLPALTEPVPGATVTLSVPATGYPLSSYQWYRDGVAVSAAAGGTVPSVTLVADSSSEGLWKCVVHNGFGSVQTETMLVPLEDSDLDGLSNYREIQILGTSPNSADTDADGYADDYEVREQSNPLQPASIPTALLKILSSPAPGYLIFSGQMGRSYQMQYSSDLIGWTDAGPAVMGTGRELAPVAISFSGPVKRFWRFRRL